MILKAQTALILIGLYVVYRLIAVLGGDSLVPPLIREMDVLALLGALSLAWLVQLFRDYPSLRRLRRNRGQRLGWSPEFLVAFLLVGVLANSLFLVVEVVHNTLLGLTFDPGMVSAGAIGSLIPFLLWALVFLIPSVRKGGIWFGGPPREEE